MKNWPSPSDDDFLDLIDPEIREEIGDPVPVPVVATVVYIPLLIASVIMAICSTGTVPGRVTSLEGLAQQAGLGLAVGLGIVALTWVLTRYLRPLQELKQRFRKELGSISNRGIVSLAILSGTAEEAFFRGVLQPWLGLMPTSLLFGALHFVPDWIFLPWTIFALGAGFAFGYMFESSGSLLAPAIAHTTVNALNLWVIVHRRRKRNLTANSPSA